MTDTRHSVVGYPSYIAQADGGYVHNTYTAGASALSLVALMRRAL